MNLLRLRTNSQSSRYVDKKFQKNFSAITSHSNNIAFLFFDGEVEADG